MWYDTPIYIMDDEECYNRHELKLECLLSKLKLVLLFLYFNGDVVKNVDDLVNENEVKFNQIMLFLLI